MLIIAMSPFGHERSIWLFGKKYSIPLELINHICDPPQRAAVEWTHRNIHLKTRCKRSAQLVGAKLAVASRLCLFADDQRTEELATRPSGFLYPLLNLNDDQAYPH
jgi:hypothetical protein